jgi:hypothetical protein
MQNSSQQCTFAIVVVVYGVMVLKIISGGIRF